MICKEFDSYFNQLKLPVFVFAMLFSMQNFVLAQSLDSLKTALVKAKEDTMKVNILIGICSENGTINDTEKLQYAKTALALSEKLNYRKGMLLTQIRLGAIMNNLGQYEEALNYLKKALTESLKSTSKNTLATIYNSMGATNYYKGDYSDALNYFLKSATIYHELKNIRKEGDIIYNMSLIYFQNKDLVNSLEYAKQSNKISVSLKDSLQIALTETQFANIAYEEYKYDTAIYYFKLSLKYTDKLNDKSYSQVNLVGLGSVLFEKKKYDEALFCHEKALKIARETNDTYSEAKTLANLGRENAVVNKFREAEELLMEAIKLSKEIGAKNITCDAYSYFAEVYEMKKDYKNALTYTWKYVRLKDSVFSEENTEQINSLNAKYENLQKENAIILLNKELAEKKINQETLNAKVREKNTVIVCILVGLFFVAFSLFLFLSRQRLKQNNEFQTQINEQQKLTASAVIQNQESERNRIAKELHDGIGTYLSTLKINLQALESNISTEKLTLYKNSAELIDKTAVELRKITKDLSTEMLQEHGLINALNELVERINISNLIKVDFISHETGQKLENITQVNLYRIAQELINNSMKHSKATIITLQLIDHDSSVLLMVEDNGLGFDATNLTNKIGMGLNNIQNRVNFLRGTFKMEAAPYKGSTFIIEVPKLVI